MGFVLSSEFIQVATLIISGVIAFALMSIALVLRDCRDVLLQQQRREPLSAPPENRAATKDKRDEDVVDAGSPETSSDSGLQEAGDTTARDIHTAGGQAIFNTGTVGENIAPGRDYNKTTYRRNNTVTVKDSNIRGNFVGNVGGNAYQYRSN